MRAKLSDTPSQLDRFQPRAVLAVSALLVCACSGASVNAPAVHRAGPEGLGYYTTYRPSDLVLGQTGAGASPEAQAPVDIDAYLKPTFAAKERAQRPKLLRSSPALPAARRSAPPASAARELASLSVPVPSPAVSVPAQSPDAERYAARERRNSPQMQYRGGDVVIIGVSTLLVILLVVLLVVLLT